MLKETPVSLRAYFGLIALMTLMPVAGQLSEGKLEIGGAIVGVVLGGLYSYVAIRLDYLLSNRPAVIRGVLLLNLVLTILRSRRPQRTRLIETSEDA